METCVSMAGRGSREGSGPSMWRAAAPARPSQPSVPVQSVSEEKTQARHLYVHRQDGPSSHVWGLNPTSPAFLPAPPCLPARGKVGKGIWAEDRVLAKAGGALGPPRGHPNRGMEPGREPDFSGPGTLAVCRPPPIPGSPGNAAVTQQQLVYFHICVPPMPSLHLSGVVRRGPHHRCLQVGPRHRGWLGKPRENSYRQTGRQALPVPSGTSLSQKRVTPQWHSHPGHSCSAPPRTPAPCLVLELPAEGSRWI